MAVICKKSFSCFLTSGKQTIVDLFEYRLKFCFFHNEKLQRKFVNRMNSPVYLSLIWLKLIRINKYVE
jgi:hypothetical protein